MDAELGKDGCPKWQKIVPPIYWIKAGIVVIADRHLPDGRRQHMTTGRVPLGMVFDNADVLGQDDLPHAEYSSQLSHLSCDSEQKKA